MDHVHEDWVSVLLCFYDKVMYHFRDLEKAAEAAFQDRNVAALDQVLAKCTHRRELSEKVQMLRSQIGVKWLEFF